MKVTSLLKTPDGKLHRGWLIFAGLCLANFALYQTGFNSLFALPLANALGVTRSAIMFFTTVYAFGAAIASVMFGALYSNPKIPVRVSMTIGVILSLCSYLLWAYAQNLFMVYAAGFLIPFSMQGIKIIGNSVFAVNWFDKSIRGKLIGVSSCFQGLGGMAMPVIIQLIINAFGFQAGYWFLIAVTVVLVLPFTLFVFERTPQDVGLLPLGYREGKSDEREKTANLYGMTLKQSMKTIAFWAMLIIVFAIGMQNGFKSNFSGIALEGLGGMMGEEDVAMVAAIMVSIASGTDFVANLLIGAVTDKIGPMKAAFAGLTIFLLFFVILLLFENQIWAFYIAAACFGFNGCLLRTPIPLTIRELFGNKHFGSIWGVCNAIKPWTAGVMATCIAFAYDLSGTYSGILIFGMIMAAIIYILYFVATRFVGKYDWGQPKGETSTLS